MSQFTREETAEINAIAQELVEQMNSKPVDIALNALLNAYCNSANHFGKLHVVPEVLRMVADCIDSLLIEIPGLGTGHATRQAIH